jgi:TonB family protein
MKTMKTISIFATIMLIAIFAFGQDQIPGVKVPEVKVTPPQFAGIENAFKIQSSSQNALINNYLSKHVNFPEKAELRRMEGTEVVQFTVTTEGNVTDFIIINSICKEIDYEVIQALQQTKGMWIPGFNNNEPVEMTKEVSMVFYLDDGTSKPTHEIFSEKATEYFNTGNINLFEKHNVKKAMKSYAMGVNYLPYDKSLLLWRGMCRYELGDKEGAREDWSRIITLGGDIDMSEYMTQIEGMKGYTDMMAILKK